jgi:hypothetical protein
MYASKALTGALLLFVVVAGCGQEGTPTGPTSTGSLSLSAWDHIVSAGGFVDFPAGNRFTLALTAKNRDDDTRGQLQMQARTTIDTAHGVIDCLNVLGNTAWVSGTFTHSPDAPAFEGGSFLVGVQDSGVGPGVGPDARTSMLVGPGPFDCNVPPPFAFTPWDSGKVLVK